MRTVSEKSLPPMYKNVSIACAFSLENLLAIFEVWLVARGSECGGRRRRDRLEVGDRFLPEIDKVVVDDAAHALQCAIDVADVGKPPRLERHPGQRLIDHRCRTAPWATRILCGISSALPLASAGLGPGAPAPSGFRRRLCHAQARRPRRLVVREPVHERIGRLYPVANILGAKLCAFTSSIPTPPAR